VDDFPLDEHDLCTVCREGAVNFDSTYSFGSYEGPLQKLILLFKYAKVESLARPLGRLLVEALPSGESPRESYDLLIAMPMHWRKQWERGFNQAALLAEHVAPHCGLKVASNLRRKRYTKSQASLSEADRRFNLKDSFYVRKPEQVAGKRVLLVDDVFTTGATLRAATAVLKSAGAAQVTALTLARVGRGASPGIYTNSDSSAASSGPQSFGPRSIPRGRRKSRSAGSGAT
jgi:competence protein ComFC